MDLKVEVKNVGVMGTGSSFFRCGLVHSSGTVYIGTYGPKPAILWKYVPKTGELRKIGTPGEYQLDCMVEAPNGIVYIGTGYSGLVYRLDPGTDEITTLGSPPVDSTPWIFAMVRTRKGEIYGAKGVGLFRLDWRTDRMEAIGLVPGNHVTLGPNPSAPVTRRLAEARDGRIYGDTNRWLFRFDPETKAVEPLVDMAGIDPACFALFLPLNLCGTVDCYFALFSRFSGKEVRHGMYVYRADRGEVEPLEIDKLSGQVVGHPDWWGTEGNMRLLIPMWHEDNQELRIAVVDAAARRQVDEWEVDGNPVSARQLPGDRSHYISFARGQVLRVEPERRRLVRVAENPVPVQCRCLAAAPGPVLGADTYDCGYVFTFDLRSGERRDHGKVWRDDHRCNYGPAAFAGKDGRYFIANHSEAMQALWVTDTHTDRHWRIGESAVQLVGFSDGSVWGTCGPNPSGYSFDEKRCWSASWTGRPGHVFRYSPGGECVETIEELGDCGPIAEAPGGGKALASCGKDLCLYDPIAGKILKRIALPATAVAAAHDAGRTVAYFLLSNGALYACRRHGDEYGVDRMLSSFGPSERGFFVLPVSARLVGVGANGTVTVYDPETGKTGKADGPVPPPAGPAVDTAEDAWYFADKEAVRYALALSPESVPLVSGGK